MPKKGRKKNNQEPILDDFEDFNDMDYNLIESMISQPYPLQETNCQPAPEHVVLSQASSAPPHVSSLN